MTQQHDEETAYAFCLDAHRKGDLYYRTVSLFAGSFADHGRDRREAYPVIVANFERIMRVLNQPVLWVRNDDDRVGWFVSYGWALVPNQYAEQRFGAFLGSRTCLKSAVGLFWDEELPRNGAKSHRATRHRNRVLARDGYRCIECGKTEADGASLTMDHVIPFSRGGETTVGNLVTLCQGCNGKHGNSAHPHLFALAGLDHDWDPRILDSAIASDPEARSFATMLSQNIMVSRASLARVS